VWFAQGREPLSPPFWQPGSLQLKDEARMSTDISIEAMSVAEKVRLFESVWESLSAHPGQRCPHGLTQRPV
jgi:hypothetical protein